MNLITEPWIPVRRADGSRDKIAPWQITDHIGADKSPVVAIASPRPDFDGALVQFLIGLLQATCTPPDKMTWRKRRREPPPAAEFKSRFETVAVAFELEGKKAFMQDFTPSELTNKLEIAALLIEAPGDQTLDQNKDHFIKRGLAERLCPHCAAAALLTLQINAPSGGRGYRTGLRGGGPLTTLIQGDSLWETCWLNVLEKIRYLGDTEPDHAGDADRFSWLAKTRTSEAKPPAGITTPVDVHPDQQFWATPRRIRLVADDLDKQTNCSLCGAMGKRMYQHFMTSNYGANYQSFEHPLSPHNVKDGASNPMHPQPGGVGYRHWLGLIENSTEGNTARKPAKVVEQFRTLAREDRRLWAFGYDMDNMKARCWYDATMPILVMPEGLEDIFKAMVEQMVRGAGWVAGIVRGRVKDALLGDSDARGDLSHVQTHFWSATERAFYAHVKNLRDVLSEPGGEKPAMESWLHAVRNAALTIFDHYAQSGDFDTADPRRIATARNDLSKALNGKKLRDVLGLPHPTRKAA